MELFDLEDQQAHPVYLQVDAANRDRLSTFLDSMIDAALAMDRPWLSHSMIKAFNFHAIAGLHYEAGRYRSCDVTVGNHQPPEHYRVRPMMDAMVDMVNRRWESTDAVQLSTYALWRLNYIHPFVNGNGRTARAICFFVLCAKYKRLFKGPQSLPQLLRNQEYRQRYYDGLADADSGNLTPLQTLVGELFLIQVRQQGSQL